MKLAICVPARDQVHTGFARSLCYLTNRLVEKQINFELHIVCGSVITESRTRLVNLALEQKATDLLWLDSDMHFPPGLFDQLYKHDKKIVAVNYSTRYAPYKSVAFLDNNNIDSRLTEKSGLHRVWAVGMGCMLVKAEVFKELPRPWFYHEYNKKDDNFSGEDIYFCNQAMHHGIDVFVDADIKVAHFGLQVNTL
jgi:hypothetical protein